MHTSAIHNGKALPIFRMLLLTVLLWTACAPQPTPAPVTESALPTPLPPSPTMIIESPMSTPETPVPVTAYEQIVGKWLSLCGAGPCTVEFKADGKYRNAYVNKTETGVSFIEGGTVTFADGILHVFTTSGGCKEEGQPDGYYQASLVHREGNLVLLLTAAPGDACKDRRNMYTRGLKLVVE